MRLQFYSDFGSLASRKRRFSIRFSIADLNTFIIQAIRTVIGFLQKVRAMLGWIQIKKNGLFNAVGFAALCMVFALQSVAVLHADEKRHDWPQFLGNARNGISTEKGLLSKWPAEGPKEVWRVAGGVGMSGIAVADGKVLTLVQDERNQYVLALNAQTGKTIWKQSVAPAYDNNMGDGPRATPTVTNGNVFVFTGEGVLAALKLASGEVLWKQNVFQELGGKSAEYGTASSPLAVEDSIVINAATSRGAVAAFDQKTGKFQWAAGKGAAGYSSPVLVNAGGREQIVAFTGATAIGVDPKSGKELWSFPWKTDYNCNTASPIAWQGKVFLSSGENHGCVLLDIKGDGDKMQVNEVWANYGRDAAMRNEWQTSILLGDNLYGFDNVGAAGPITHFNCVNIATGKRVWQKPRFGKGNLIAADGKLFCSTIEGELVVLKASPQGYEELGRTKVTGSTRQAPALANGLLYLRDSREIVCIDVRE